MAVPASISTERQSIGRSTLPKYLNGRQPPPSRITGSARSTVRLGDEGEFLFEEWHLRGRDRRELKNPVLHGPAESTRRV
jgi:hypothetical protein